MADALRLDLFLWFARISASRTFAQDLASKRHLRIDGRVIEKSAAPVRVGNVLTFANHRGEVRSLRVTSLPSRRGPPEEARACYTDLIDGAGSAT